MTTINEINYTSNSGSYYSGEAVQAFPLFQKWNNPPSRTDLNFGVAEIPGNECSASYTYYQRVYDNINTFWCYYSGSTVNESPGMTDTTPHNSGDISGYSIIYVTDQIVCS